MRSNCDHMFFSMKVNCIKKANNTHRSSDFHNKSLRFSINDHHEEMKGGGSFHTALILIHRSVCCT